MEEMMERKMKFRINQMEAQWEQRQITMTRQVNQVTQTEQFTSDQLTQIQSNIQNAESMLTQLTKTLTILIDRIEEVDTAIQEVDEATNAMADFRDAEEITRATFINTAKDIKEAYGRDAKALTGFQLWCR
jgi:methyl-accepting chemotaxis protein